MLAHSECSGDVNLCGVSVGEGIHRGGTHLPSQEVLALKRYFLVFSFCFEAGCYVA